MHHPTRSLSILALSGILLLSGCKKAAQPQAMAGEKLSMSFMDLVKLGKNYKCTFTDTTGAGATNQGTVYVEGGGRNFRGDFTMTQNAKTIESHVIRKGNVSHVWSTEAQQGFTMTVDDDASLFGQANAQQNVGIKDGEPVDFDCETWTPNAMLFTPPTDRTFTDMNAMMQGLPAMNGAMKGNAAMNGTDAMKAAQCGACNQVPDSTGKAQCKAALGC